MNKVDWLPDWREESQYPSTEKMLSVQWAWEFLRRNPEYQTDFVSLPGVELTAKWSISIPLDPSATSKHEFILSRDFSFKPSGLFRMIPGDILQVAEEMIKPEHKSLGTLAIFLDLSKPLGDQFRRLEQAALGAQKAYCARLGEPVPKLRAKNYRPQDYATYLRVLDGLSVNASLLSMAEFLFGMEEDPSSAYRKLVRNKKAALDLRNGGYLDICRIADDCDVPCDFVNSEGERVKGWYFPC